MADGYGSHIRRLRQSSGRHISVPLLFSPVAPVLSFTSGLNTSLCTHPACRGLSPPRKKLSVPLRCYKKICIIGIFNELRRRVCSCSCRAQTHLKMKANPFIEKFKSKSGEKMEGIALDSR